MIRSIFDLCRSSSCWRQTWIPLECFTFFYWNGLPMWMHLKSILWELIRLWSLKSISRQLNIFQAATFTFLSKVSIAFALMWIFSIGVALFEFKCWVDIAVESVDFDANYYFQRLHCSIDTKHCLLIKVLQQQKKLVNMNETSRKKNSMTQWNARIAQVLSGTWTFKSEDFMRSPLVDWIPPAVNTQAWCLIAQIKAHRNNIVLQHRMGPNANNNIFLFKCNIIFFV